MTDIIYLVEDHHGRHCASAFLAPPGTGLAEEPDTGLDLGQLYCGSPSGAPSPLVEAWLSPETCRARREFRRRRILSEDIRILAEPA